MRSIFQSFKKDKAQIFLSILFVLSSCSEDDGPPPEIDPTNDASALSKAFVIDGDNLNGEIPETNSNNIAEIAFFQQSASITNDNQLFVPMGYNSPNIEGLYLKVSGADNYWRIPFNSSAKSSKNQVSSKKVNDNTFVLSIGVPSNIMNGSFNLEYKLFNSSGDIGISKELDVSIISPEALCVAGNLLGRVEGTDGIDVRTYTLGEQSGWVSILYNTFTVKDRLDVKYNGEWIRSTGNLINNSAPPIKKCSDATGSDGFVSGTNSFDFFYDPSEGNKVDVYVSGCLDGGTQWEYQILECPKDKITLGVHSNVPPTAGLTDGHAWVSITQNGMTTFYGLWPDGHELTTDNGNETDIRTNLERGIGPFRRFYPLTENQYQRFQNLINENKEWSLTYNCSSWAEEVILNVTGENVDAGEAPGVESPRRMSSSILSLESENPTASQYIPENVSEDKSSCSFCF